MARVARKYLALPATSTESERLWSKAGNIVTKKRAALKEENVNAILFVLTNFAQVF